MQNTYVKRTPWEGLISDQNPPIMVGLIKDINLDNYTCTVALTDKPGQRVEVPLNLYTFESSWGRQIPDKDTPVLVSFRSRERCQIVAFYDKWTIPNNDKFNKGEGIYRQLSLTESDLMSKGWSGYWNTDAGRFLLHGGGVMLELNHHKMETIQEAALHRFLLPPATYNDPQQTMNQIRFGTVKRVVNGEEKIVTKDDIPISQGGMDLQEFHLDIGCVPISNSGSYGAKLAELKLGHCVDENGKEIKLDSQANEVTSGEGTPIRARLKVFTQNSLFSFNFEVDETGALVLTIPPTSLCSIMRVLGGDLELKVDKGAYRVMAGKDITMGSESLDIGTRLDARIVADGGVSINGTTYTNVNGANVVNVVAQNTLQSAANICNEQFLVQKNLIVPLKNEVLGNQTTTVAETYSLLASLAILGGNVTRLGPPTATQYEVLLKPLYDAILAHTHPGVTRGSGVTDPPTITATNPYSTTVFASV